MARLQRLAVRVSSADDARPRFDEHSRYKMKKQLPIFGGGIQKAKNTIKFVEIILLANRQYSKYEFGRGNQMQSHESGRISVPTAELDSGRLRRTGCLWMESYARKSVGRKSHYLQTLIWRVSGTLRAGR